jgi:hypothetical protein
VAAKGKITPAHVAVAAAIGALGVLAWTATRSAGPVPDRQGPFTELEAPAQNFVSHLAHLSEFLVAPVFTPHRFPDRTCPGTTQTIHQGFAPRYALPDPQLAALPAEEPW